MPICDAIIKPEEYTCKGNKKYSPKYPIEECSGGPHLNCSLHRPPIIQRFASDPINPCEDILCKGSGSQLEQGQSLEKDEGRRIDRRENVDRFIISPNPATETFTVLYTGGTATLTIRNMLGLVVSSERFSGQVIINTENIQSGVYIVEVIGADNSRCASSVIIHK